MRSARPTIIAPATLALERLRLRRPKASDADAIFEYASDPEVTRYMDWPTSTNVASVRALLDARAHAWNSGAEFYWVVTRPAEDKALGTASCCVSGHSADFGYVLNRKVWGQGYGTEVSLAIVQWVFSVPAIWRLWATCDAENLASARVLEKSGLSREGILRRAIVRPNISSEPRDALLYAKVR